MLRDRYLSLLSQKKKKKKANKRLWFVACSLVGTLEHKMLILKRVFQHPTAPYWVVIVYLLCSEHCGCWVCEEASCISIELLVPPNPVKLAPFYVKKLYMIRLFSVIRAELVIEHQIRRM